MEWTNPALVIPVIGAVAVAILGGFWTVSAARLAQTASPYGELAKRTVELEHSTKEAWAQLAAQGETITRQGQTIATLQSSDRRKGREIVYLRDEVHALAAYARDTQQWFKTGMKSPKPVMSAQAEAVLARLAQHDELTERRLEADLEDHAPATADPPEAGKRQR